MTMPASVIESRGNFPKPDAQKEGRHVQVAQPCTEIPGAGHFCDEHLAGPSARAGSMRTTARTATAGYSMLRFFRRHQRPCPYSRGSESWPQPKRVSVLLIHGTWGD